MSTKSVFHHGGFVTCNDLPDFNSIISTEATIYQVALLGGIYKHSTSVLFCHLLKCFSCLFDKQYENRSDCSGSTLLTFILKLVNDVMHLVAADDFSRRDF